MRNIIKGEEGRIIMAEFRDFTFINMYAPAGRLVCEERNNFFQVVLPPYWISATSQLVVFGDFNAVEFSGDRTTTEGQMKKLSNDL